jgi:2-polyprenyl-3-methyl-5-hydroxy-6-metoxy-1,4-benzoquinol methylase
VVSELTPDCWRPIHAQIGVTAGRAYIGPINKSEFSGQRFNRHNERPIEFAFVFCKIAELRPRTVLDVGSGTTALPSLMASCGCVVTATDNIRDYWLNGMINKHWHVIDDDIKASRLTEQFDLVTCVSVIEHH